MEDFKREDYIYLRYLEDDEENSIKKGDIVRYKKEILLHEMQGRRFKDSFSEEDLEWIENKDIDENEVMFNKVYQSITIKKECKRTIYLWKDDYLYLDEWLFSHLDQQGINVVTNIGNKKIPTSKENDKLIKLTEDSSQIDGRVDMYFKEGELLDFTHPSIATLFYNPYYLKIFAKTEVIVGEEKDKLFNEDFSNAIYIVEVENSTLDYSSKKEHHYFKVKEDIKVKTKDELANLLKVPYLDYNKNIVKDKQGFITHLSIVTNNLENSDRNMEQLILKVAGKVSRKEALEIHKKACLEHARKKKQEEDAMMKKWEEQERKLDISYQKIKDNPEIFSGVNGYFMHVNKEKEKFKSRYTLEQIKMFYKNLKKLDSDIVKQMCFYGGTIPYILNNASISRDFGDIDIFLEVKYMEDLRKELSHEPSFEMLCDSKPYATACMLTSRITKEQTKIVLPEKKENLSQNITASIVETFAGLIVPREYRKGYLDENGIVHNPLNVHREKELSYYRKIQDFGFKAKLFGIDISVFPLYEYENNIMAKSFNINEINKFLLGVKVLNNTNIRNFVKQVNIYDTLFNILPLEYTLVSKKSAVDKNFVYRYERDKEDVEYILAHKNELEIKEETMERITENYPDYSISIAYKIEGDEITTMDGKTYKKAILTNRNLS